MFFVTVSLRSTYLSPFFFALPNHFVTLKFKNIKPENAYILILFLFYNISFFKFKSKNQVKRSKYNVFYLDLQICRKRTYSSKIREHCSTLSRVLWSGSIKNRTVFPVLGNPPSRQVTTDRAKYLLHYV